MPAAPVLRGLQTTAFAFAAACVLVTVIAVGGIYPGVGLGFDAAALVPLVVAAADLLLVTLLERQAPPPSAVDPVGAAHLLRTTALVRMAFAEAPTLVGFVLVFVLSDTVLPVVLGLLGSLVLFAVWWPGERLVAAVRRRIEPIGGGPALNEALR
ncbi:hypothetical protein LX15_005151 [Streptoalloteichus tenebrarius]|uniref:MFS transporter n=1 Tax=Streptoalloteichus tenebrarius (strain ATCC 17920 / DSM 40477 / JCM 4838 / CBS 697.72 / NBRC 16177 / NCIMB 11028 / NRRL B-12390 / A12253. 1 / ISP 5477) TaxID=1933 RepID=A0ABT1I1G0_STRSD|nr:hypothetical protein [Streptoalloteichus tenebrarius]MCP2261425.1 hypothetical protein [Streptoalloteichus tenebrarius]BFF02029.1 hypothetical protein GCM10020241_37040 [Streptoalloteichus tenebrarius]